MSFEAVPFRHDASAKDVRGGAIPLRNGERSCDDRRRGCFQETVDGPNDTQLEQQGAERLGGAAGRADHQQEPVGGRRRVGHRSGGHDRRPAAVPVGQLAGAAGLSRGLSDRARRAAHRLQPVAGFHQHPELSAVPRLPNEVSAVLAI